MNDNIGEELRWQNAELLNSPAVVWIVSSGICEGNIAETPEVVLSIRVNGVVYEVVQLHFAARGDLEFIVM